MNICHTISSINAKSGGTSTYMQLLANELSKHVDLSLAYIESNDDLSISEMVQLQSFTTSFPHFQAHSAHLNRYFKSANIDLFHGNGLWMYPVHAMCKNSRKRKIPYIISTHGMLAPWALNLQKWKKQIAMKLYQKDDLDEANCIHATSFMEADYIKKLGFKNPIALIPNGVCLNDFPVKEKKNNEQKTLLFFSRIHPVKGIELLIEACRIAVSKCKFKIVIAGNGEVEYIKTLQDLIHSKNLTNIISIIEPQYGLNKLRTFHNADIFILPSYTENFGIVVAEALACGLPVIATQGTPWNDLEQYNCGWWINNTVEDISKTLEIAMTTDSDVLHEMGLRGRKLIEEKYSIESVTHQMIELYEWILGKIDKPKFIC